MLLQSAESSSVLRTLFLWQLLAFLLFQLYFNSKVYFQQPNNNKKGKKP